MPCRGLYWQAWHLSLAGSGRIDLARQDRVPTDFPNIEIALMPVQMRAQGPEKEKHPGWETAKEKEKEKGWETAKRLAPTSEWAKETAGVWEMAPASGYRPELVSEMVLLWWALA